VRGGGVVCELSDSRYDCDHYDHYDRDDCDYYDD
jgi:hypothetical protein